MSPDYIPTCKMVLDNTKSPYAQLLASSSLMKIMSEHALTVPVKVEMRSYFLRYLDERGPGLEPFVVTSIVQLLCRMTKLGWFEDEMLRPIVDEGKVFLEKGMTVCDFFLCYCCVLLSMMISMVSYCAGTVQISLFAWIENTDHGCE